MSSPTQSAQPWWRSLNREHWFVFTIASLAWLFDCLDSQFFNLARDAAMDDLLVDKAAEDLYPTWRQNQEQWKLVGGDFPYHYLGSAIWFNRIGKAMGEKKGKVILLESVIPAGSTPDLGKFIDIEMLLLPGGRERTADEFRSLFERSGFTMTRVVPMKSPLSVIEAVLK